MKSSTCTYQYTHTYSHERATPVAVAIHLILHANPTTLPTHPLQDRVNKRTLTYTHTCIQKQRQAALFLNSRKTLLSVGAVCAPAGSLLAATPTSTHCMPPNVGRQWWVKAVVNVSWKRKATATATATAKGKWHKQRVRLVRVGHVHWEMKNIKDKQQQRSINKTWQRRWHRPVTAAGGGEYKAEMGVPTLTHTRKERLLQIASKCQYVVIAMLLCIYYLH